MKMKVGMAAIKTIHQKKYLILPDLHNEEESPWWRSIAGFDSVCGQPRVLCGWVGGEAAARMEARTDEEILDTCTRLLRTHVGQHVPRPVILHCF